MKKVVFSLAFSLAVTALHAGQFYWGLDVSVSAPTDTVGYLVNVGGSSVTVAGINSHIATNGLDVAGLKTAAWASASAATLNGDLVRYLNTNAVPNTDYYFALFLLDKDEQTVTVGTQILKVVPAVTADDNMGSPTEPNYYEWVIEEDTEKWASVTTSGGDTPGGNVPEPTVFALLALGVAGVALRRKTK